jgi:hypothetical protein
MISNAALAHCANNPIERIHRAETPARHHRIEVT